MINVAHIILLGATLATALAFLGFAVAAAFGREGARYAGVGLLAAGLAALTVSLGLRWAETGHGPYLGSYEALASYGWALIAVFLAVQWRFPAGRMAGLGVAPVALLLLGAAVLSPSAPQYPSPAMRSLWLWMHVGMAKVALASLVVSGGTSWVYLRRRRVALVGAGKALSQKVEDGEEDTIPVSAGASLRSPQDRLFESLGMNGPASPEATIGEVRAEGNRPSAAGHSQGALEELGVNLVSLGFLVLAVVLGSGALWANTAWGAYWNWDPIETWALATWIAYGIVLHLGRFGKASGAKWARWNLGALVFSAVLFVLLRLLAISPHWIYIS